MPDAPVITPAEFLGKLSCKSDAIVVGSVKSKSSHMTEDETFIYTEYEFSVQDIVKNNSASPIEINNQIQITRPGGIIKLDNRIIRIEDQSYEPLQKNKKYLLFLRFVPTANGYMVASPEGDFILENNAFKTLAKRPLPKELKSDNNSETLLNAVRNSTSVVCNQIPKEAIDIVWIEVDYKESKRIDEHGNRFKYRAKVKKARGTQVNRWAWDVFLVAAPSHNSFAEFSLNKQIDTLSWSGFARNFGNKIYSKCGG